jgi:hypothetical protein
MKKILALCFLITNIFISCNAFGFDIYVGTDFVNSGKLNSEHLNITAGQRIINNGSLIAADYANITSNELLGSGLIKGPYITIYTDIFNYTGTIQCLTYCEIHTKNKFNESMFIREGNGEFKIIISQ